jgi:hypothetical protein
MVSDWSVDDCILQQCMKRSETRMRLRQRLFAVAELHDKRLRDARSREVYIKFGETCRRHNEKYARDLRSQANKTQCSLSAT